MTTLAGVRSLLFAPGSDERKLRKALSTGADAVIADLEDAVAPGAKEEARRVVAAVLVGHAPGVVRCIRVNAAGSAEMLADLELVERIRPHAVIVPKAEPGTVPELPDGVVAIALIETAAGLRGAYQLACMPRVNALMLGSADLSSELGLEPRDDGLELLHARSQLVVDAAAAGVVAPLDGPELRFREIDRLRAQVAIARSLGLGGKACIHPDQVRIVNEGFAPRADEVEWARRALAAQAAGHRDGRGAVELEGTMIDEPVAARARAILARSEGRTQ